jgi:hypothetical protein
MDFLASNLKFNYMEMKKIKLKKAPLRYIGDKAPYNLGLEKFLIAVL